MCGQGRRVQGFVPKVRVRSERDPNKSQRRQVQDGSLGWGGSKQEDPSQEGSRGSPLRGVHSPQCKMGVSKKGPPQIQQLLPRARDMIREERGPPDPRGAFGDLGGIQGSPKGREQAGRTISTGEIAPHPGEGSSQTPRGMTLWLHGEG